MHRSPESNFLKWAGLEPARESGDEVACRCVTCGRSEKMHVNCKKGVVHCKACGFSCRLLEALGQLLADEVIPQASSTEIRRLAQDRMLPLYAFDSFDIRHKDGFYALPVHNFRGELVNLLRYRPGGKLLAAPRMTVGLFGAEQLATESRASEQVNLLEGPWDAIAADIMFRLAEKPGIAVGVPGALTFKREWCPWFEGRNVVVCYDNDHAGRQGEHKVRSMLSGVAASLQFLHWEEGLPEGFDISDLIGGAL